MPIHTQGRGPWLQATEEEEDLLEITKPGSSRAKGELRSIRQLHGYGMCVKAGVLGWEQGGGTSGLRW